MMVSSVLLGICVTGIVMTITDMVVAETVWAVQNRGRKRELAALDRKYNNGPVPVGEWLDIHRKYKHYAPVITKACRNSCLNKSSRLRPPTSLNKF